MNQNKYPPIGAQNIFAHIEEIEDNSMLAFTLAYRADPSPNKMDLGVGAYRDDDGNPVVLQVVRDTEQEITADHSLNKEYQPFEGIPDFWKSVQALTFGANHPIIMEGNVLTIQSMSGNQALATGLKFAHKFLSPRILISSPTWVNHDLHAENIGFQISRYRYFGQNTRRLDFEGMLEDISKAEPNTLVLIQDCGHNPTGIDPSREQWEQIIQIFKQGQLIPFIDSAYLGFVSDIDTDAWVIRRFVEEGFQFIISQSFSKNFGLYGERIGAVHFITSDATTTKKVSSQVKLIARTNYSCPPLFPARLVSRILLNEEKTKQWKQELKEQVTRIQSVRRQSVHINRQLREEIENLKVSGDWSFITEHKGMFTYTGFTPDQCKRLQSEFHVYLPTNGRINVAGISSKNVKYLAESIATVVSDQSSK